jgi:hypothetical protein
MHTPEGTMVEVGLVATIFSGIVNVVLQSISLVVNWRILKVARVPDWLMLPIQYKRPGWFSNRLQVNWVPSTLKTMSEVWMSSAKGDKVT